MLQTNAVVIAAWHSLLYWRNEDFVQFQDRAESEPDIWVGKVTQDFDVFWHIFVFFCEHSSDWPSKSRWRKLVKTRRVHEVLKGQHLCRWIVQRKTGYFRSLTRTSDPPAGACAAAETHGPALSGHGVRRGGSVVKKLGDTVPQIMACYSHFMF